MKKQFLSIVVIFFITCGIITALGACYFAYVSEDVLHEMQSGVIERSKDSQSYAYYDDHEQIIGVFFDKVHQRHIQFRELPDMFVKALIAAEDKNFFQHHGFDIKTIFRAAVANIRAHKVVQGGSTITQQTAKNLFKRQKRSFGAKLRELVEAVHLEKRYTKEKILEIYANQFYVAGLGKGIGVASQYYFDKDVSELNLVESAFIAGSIKGPGKYNPFIKKTTQEKTTAIQNARERKNYVLKNMLNMKSITREQYLTARDADVPFQKGKISYELSSVMDYIRKQLQSDFFKAVLEEEGIDNIATSGIKIYTSINREIQDGAIQGLRNRLALLDTMLSGYGRERLNQEYEKVSKSDLAILKEDAACIGRILTIDKKKSPPHMVVALDDGREVVVDSTGMQALCDAWLKSRTGIWAEFDQKYLPSFLNLFQKDDRVAIKMMDQSLQTSRPFAVLTKLPELQGGIIVLQDGMIKAMAGGFFNRYWNRTVDSKRQLGSVFKPILFAAALQLNWNLQDLLNNTKELYQFEKTAYLPMPDHDPVSDKISMIWAGAKSENLASVWLMDHLTDQLDSEEFFQLVQIVGLNQKPDESDRAYIQRIRDRWGIMTNDSALMESSFYEFREELESVLAAFGQNQMIQRLKHLRFKPSIQMTDDMKKEVLKICPFSFEELKAFNLEMKQNIETMMALIKDAENEDDIRAGLVRIEGTDHYIIDESTPEFRLMFVPAKKPATRNFACRPLTPEWLLDHMDQIKEEDIWIDDQFPSRIIDLIESGTNRNFLTLKENLKNNVPGFFFKLKDFKTLTGMLYVKKLSKDIGISSPMEPVLSFPLGVNAVSIAEMAVAYQTLMTTEVFPFADTNSPDMIPVITQIVDRDGMKIWAYKTERKKALSDRVSILCREILKMVVERGTAQSARGAVRMSMPKGVSDESITIPVYGKTGTSDNYANSSFVGYIPGSLQNSSEPRSENGYVISCYVGYDDNRPMKGKKITIYGSSGALPMWIDTANAIANSKNFRQRWQPYQQPVVQNEVSPQETPLSSETISPLEALSITPLEEDDGATSPPYIWSDDELNALSGILQKRTFEPRMTPFGVGN
ncbi:MAG: transglycosylase domain-containing protein [Proteobacteria bacterium]|nr:transglycosylase domain-containing protein [Pseudomonadota bacterium]